MIEPTAPEQNPPTPLIVDLFAGPGGWDEGLALLGRSDVVGLEWDAAACKTAKTAGHARIRCDVATYPTEPFVGIEGLIASPPCQAWSMAGKRKGELDRANCHTLADRMAGGDDSIDWTVWEDDKSPLVCQPVRWVRDLCPDWIALEEVPAVASLWEHFARIFRGWGYSVWTGDLCAADYGVPQTRTRRILMASRTMTVQPPVATHTQWPADGVDLFGDQLEGWVSMATALGWNDDDHLVHPRGKGMIERHGPRDDRVGCQPAMTVTSKSRSWERFVSKPAPTLVTTRRSKDGMLVGRQLADAGKVAGVRVTVIEAGLLQSFPEAYPWQGSNSKRHEQVGNAIPPRLAMHVLAALGVTVVVAQAAVA
jgi:DNA (cytosine-5)-methyltransferase 1